MTFPNHPNHPAVPVRDWPRAAFRLIAFFVHLVVWYLIYYTGRLACCLFRIPPRPWREFVFTRWARTTLDIMGVHISVRGTIPPPPAIQVANHLGYLDIIVLAACGPTRFLSKVEVGDWPVIGRIVTSVDTLLIDRSNYRDLERVSEEILTVYQSGESITFFPEGTSHNGQEILPLRSPLLKMPARENLAVSPIGITYYSGDVEYPAYRDICWWDNVPFFSHLFRCCAVPKIYAEINYDHEPVYREDRKDFANELHIAIRRLTRP